MALGNQRQRRRRLFLAACVASWMIGSSSAFAAGCGQDTASAIDELNILFLGNNVSLQEIDFRLPRHEYPGLTSKKPGLFEPGGDDEADVKFYFVSKNTLQAIFTILCQNAIPAGPDKIAKENLGYRWQFRSSAKGASPELVTSETFQKIESIARTSLHPIPGATP